MGTDKPLVSILMAVYKPNEKWLREQLSSLNAQTYPNLELVIYDDCPERPLEESIVREMITAFPYRVIRGEKNLGSNKAFERLTVEGEGEYFSYCDQDDVWHPDKIQRMAKVLEDTGSPLVCSDLAIIDGGGNKLADSITKVRKRHVFYDGEGLSGYLLVRNFVTGCAMMMRADVAKGAVPFVDSLVHDQWLAINAALCGRIEVIREPLIDYRQHGGNQTGVLMSVNSKQDYYNMRIENMRRRIIDYKARLSEYDELSQVIADLEEFNEARSRYFYGHKSADLRIMRKYKSYSRQAVLLETIMPFLPEWTAKVIFSIIRSGII
ncbi:MAG: glycosyltransferase family 2 protein [Oscillospiraceae bacterium]|nr:glycosyltransferase family 2 protein [Oscillospiraceae bacterium]